MAIAQWLEHKTRNYHVKFYTLTKLINIDILKSDHKIGLHSSNQFCKIINMKNSNKLKYLSIQIILYIISVCYS